MSSRVSQELDDDYETENGYKTYKICERLLTQNEINELCRYTDSFDKGRKIENFQSDKKVMSKDQMVKEINKKINMLPDRSLMQESDILEKYRFDGDLQDSENDIKSVLDAFVKIPKERFNIQDVIECLKDFEPTEGMYKNQYFKDKIELIKEWDKQDRKFKNGTRKHYTKSEMVQIKERNEIYLIVYQIESRQKNLYVDSYITQCFIFRYDSIFILIHQFLVDINTKGNMPTIFNRVYINAKGIYYLQKFQTLDHNGEMEDQIIVNQIKFDEKEKTGFDDFKQNSQKVDQKLKIKKIKCLKIKQNIIKKKDSTESSNKEQTDSEKSSKSEKKDQEELKEGGQNESNDQDEEDVEIDEIIMEEVKVNEILNQQAKQNFINNFKLKHEKKVSDNEEKSPQKLNAHDQYFDDLQRSKLEDLDIGFIMNISDDFSTDIEKMFVVVNQYQNVAKSHFEIYSLQTSNPIIAKNIICGNSEYFSAIRYHPIKLKWLDYAFMIKDESDIIHFILQSGFRHSHCEIIWKGLIKGNSETIDLFDYRSAQEVIVSEKYGRYNGRIHDQQLTIERLQVDLLDQNKIEYHYFISTTGDVQLIYPFEKYGQNRDQIKEFIFNHHKIKASQKVFTYLSSQNNRYQNVNDEIINYLKDLGSYHYNNFFTQRIFMEDMIIIMDKESNLDIIQYVKDNQAQNKLVSQCLDQLSTNESFLSNQLNQFHFLNRNWNYQDNYNSYFNQRYMTNQKIWEMYMHRQKKQIVLSNHLCIIKNIEYIFNEKYFIFFTEQDNKINIQLLQLYSPSVEYTKLTKYHYSNNYAIFFFLYRFHDGAELNGVHFFIILPLQNLRKMTGHDSYLLNKDTNVYIMKKLNQIEQTKLNFNQMRQYCDYDKFNNGSSNELVFELTRDLADPTKEYFPFLFYQKIDVQKFEIYFCFLNVEQAGEYLKEKKQNESKLQLTQFIQSFYIQFYQREDEPIQFFDCNKKNAGLRMNVLAQQRRSQNLFCRTTNWIKNQKNNEYNAVFQMGFNIEQYDLQAIELRDIYVQIDLSEQKYNFMNNKNTEIKFKPIQMKYITFSQKYIKDIVSSNINQEPIENHRLVSRIDDDGNIDGSLLLFNHKQSSEQGIIETYDYERVKYPRKINKQNLNPKKNMNEGNENDIKEQFEQQEVKSLSSENTTENIRIFKYYIEGLVDQDKYDNHSGNDTENFYIYDVIDLRDTNIQLDISNSIQTKMCKMFIQKQTYFSISSVCLNEKCINQYNFTSNHLIYWLYYFQKNFMSARQILLFTDLYGSIDLKQIDEQYFQPLLILGGKNKFYLNRKSIEINDIKNIFALQNKKYNGNSHIYNSQVFLKSKFNEKFLKNFNIKPIYDFHSDVFQRTSIIESLVEAKKIKEVLYLVNTVIKTNMDQQTTSIILQDMTMLLEYQKIDINQFLNVSVDENSEFKHYSHKESEDKQFFCNLEQIITSDQLDMFGSDEQIVHYPNSFSGMHFQLKEMIEIINQDRSNDQNVQVQYSVINFDKMIKKIQIDLINKDIKEPYEHLQFFIDKPNVTCSHLFLAKIIDKCYEIENFFEQNTIQKIIDIQFKTTKQEIKKYLVIFSFGFFIPYIYNSLSLNQILDIENESRSHFIFRWFLYTICSLTQLYFARLEIPELYIQTFQIYMSEIYNQFDFLLPTFFIQHLILRFMYGKVEGFGGTKVYDNVVEIIIIIGSAFKLLQYLRYKEEYSYFVQMFFSVMYELVPFLFVFALFIVVFTMFQIILGSRNPDQGSDYPGVHQYLKMLIQTFRVSIGDLQVSDYSQWADDPSADDLSFNSNARKTIVAFVWAFWILDIYLILIVMLNLLIAQVGQIYEKVMSQTQTSIYKERAQLNLKVFQNLYFFGEKHEFEALIMQSPLQNIEKFDFDDFTTFSERVKKSTKATVDKMKNEMQIFLLDIEKNIGKNTQTQIAILENKIENNIDIKLNSLLMKMDQLLKEKDQKKDESDKMNKIEKPSNEDNQNDKAQNENSIQNPIQPKKE